MSQVRERAPEDYTYVNVHDLPYRLLSLVHTCDNYSGSPEPYSKRMGPPMCGGCNKVVPWFVHKCYTCDEYFIRDFRHPNFCFYSPTCWTHTQEFTELCGHQNYLCSPELYKDPRLLLYVEPLGLNPKILSKEELASFDIFADL